MTTHIITVAPEEFETFREVAESDCRWEVPDEAFRAVHAREEPQWLVDGCHFAIVNRIGQREGEENGAFVCRTYAEFILKTRTSWRVGHWVDFVVGGKPVYRARITHVRPLYRAGSADKGQVRYGIEVTWDPESKTLPRA